MRNHTRLGPRPNSYSDSPWALISLCFLALRPTRNKEKENQKAEKRAPSPPNLPIFLCDNLLGPRPSTMTAISSYLRYSAADRRYYARWKHVQLKANLNSPECPCLCLTFDAKPSIDLEVDTSYAITFTITRKADDPERRPCIFHWDPIEHGFGQSGFMLCEGCMTKLRTPISYALAR
jgi:hypothetical protein